MRDVPAADETRSRGMRGPPRQELQPVSIPRQSRISANLFIAMAT